MRKIIPDYAFAPLLFLVAFQFLVYSGTMQLSLPQPYLCLETPYDRMVPFLPWTVLIYTGSFAFWVVNCILSTRFDRERASRFLSADLIAKVICLICFLFFPTTVTRPEITGNDFWSLVMKFIYTVDRPTNLFPSLHCLMSWQCYLGVRGEQRIPKGYRIFSGLFPFVVFLSTLTTKQHVIADVLAGWLISGLCYRIAGHPSVTRLYRRIFRI